MVGQKKKNISANTAYPVTAFIQKPPPVFAFAMLRQTSDIRKCYPKCRSAITNIRGVAILYNARNSYTLMN